MFKNMVNAIKGFLKDVNVELKKVSFPTKKETISSTTVVVVFIIIFSIILALLDYILVNLVKIVI